MLLLIFTVLCFAEAKCGAETRFQNAPSYTTANRWTDSRGKRTALNGLKTDSPLTLHLDTEKRYPKGTCLIIRKTQLKITAFTKNKVLLDKDEDNGESYVIIPVEEVLKGERITLLLEPKSNCIGSVTDTVRLQSRNDFYYMLLYENRKRLLMLAGAVTAAVLFLVKRKTYASLGLAALALWLLTASPLAQFVFGFAAICTAMKYASGAAAIFFLLVAIRKRIC